LALSVLGCKKEVQTPEIKLGDKILIAFQNSKKVYYFLPDSQKFYFLFNTGDVPNYFILNNNEVYLINSGGFNGSPSIQKFNFINNEVSNFLLPENLNPLSGVILNNNIYFTDFGKFYSENIYVFNGQIIDSLKISNRPIDIKVLDSFLIVSTNGMRADYSYDTISKVFKISINSLKKVDSLIVFPGASNICIYKDTIFLVSTGIYNQTNSRIYKIYGKTFEKLDSLNLSKNIFYADLNDNYLVLGSWDGWIYVLSHNLSVIDSLKISNSINFIYSFGDKFYITANGFSFNPNYLMIYKPFSKLDSIKFSNEDLGIGPVIYLKEGF